MKYLFRNFNLWAAAIVMFALLLLEFGLGFSLPRETLYALLLIAWGLVCLLLAFQNSYAQFLEEAFRRLNFREPDGNFESKLANLVQQSERFHRASYSFSLEKRNPNKPLGQNLREIAERAYLELGAKAVELSLFDKESGLWSQAILLGEPDSLNTQSMLHEASLEEQAPLINDGAGEVIIEELQFAGSMFGALRVEMYKGDSPAPEDRQILRLLSVSGSLLLVDAKFTEELLMMKRLGEESLKAKTGFLANLSHEIRGPLSVILNGAELTMDGLCGPVTESQKETLRMIKDNGDHLLDLVNDVLDYAKVEAGKVAGKPVEIHVKELLKDLLTLVRSQATVKKHKMVLEEVDEDLGILCDKRHSRQILINFLTNAIKYTPQGGTVSVGAEWMKNGRAKIWIRDTGVGIPEEYRSKVFGAFERVDEKYSNSQTGTGLGMPLTKKLAEVNGGSVDFESVEEEGSTFWVVLPAVNMTQVAKKAASESKMETEEKAGKGEKVLIVDHDDQTRAMYEQYLGHHGFEIINAACGRDVLRVLREEKIRLAVVENEMPDIGGEDMVLAIRANPMASDVPIILLSSKAFVFDIEHFLKLGVDRCLSKPVELSELASTARRLIDESKPRVES